ncbi:MAG: phosphoribosylformylglycinamidine synthase subunit PurL [Thermoplasmata archaeon]|uniref:Phosphoribosylformylglycinamidine synthase subunit PurL n=1 Tax=Candidatus Sysuiplasma superficiale TaxID=2823368 RepID=A0A8J7YJP2_9ARCH|nr:phosphoribosylformylglycinamidine synthase subunit PurL [Candidatus Sysuiplasma superficiale]MBX8643301.1 phosphoribosylformylglycinamidine synthase subunit PurL [Candidatus Sysuiplasma superficiale]MCL4346389.1 phosphoribosylformylglycinamidine synthase subunit PurL [Candidatus Thermoplasmatota archaeon]
MRGTGNHTDGAGLFWYSGTDDVWNVRIREADDEQLLEINRRMELGLTLDELTSIRKYFIDRGRDATDIEMQAIAQAWSEHCSYKTSKSLLRKHVFPLAGRAFASGDAGVMEFDADHVYSLKMESHNHPSAIEPYGGAGTGIGGIVRDILCMGTKPVALADPIFFGDLDVKFDSLPDGSKHPKYLFSGVVSGIRDYGNRIGVPTISGGVWFDNSYLSNCLVNAGCVGFGRKDRVMVNHFISAGNAIILAGGLTGKDGIHGVNFASRSLTSQAHESDRGAVQLGDPITKEPLIHAILQLVEDRKILSMKDLGGGGLSAVVGEMCVSGDLGATIDIDAVPLRERGMKPWEIWVSESQERMLLSVREEDIDAVLSVFDFWDINARNIGQVTGTGNIVVTHKGRKILELDSLFTVKAKELDRPTKERRIRRTVSTPNLNRELFGQYAERVISDPNVCSRDWIVHMYDYEVGGRSVIKPLHGLPGRQSHGDASVIRPVTDSWKGLGISVASQPWVASVDPYQGSLHAVDELCRNLVSVGARPDAITNCLNFGDPGRPEVMWEFSEAVRGMADASSAMGIALPSGNVSFYNDGSRGPIMPTVSLMGTGIVDDVRKCLTSDLKREGSDLYFIGAPTGRLGCSTLSRIAGLAANDFPQADISHSARMLRRMLSAISEGLFISCHDVSQGGLFTTLAEMSFGGGIGFRSCFNFNNSISPVNLLFSEPPSCWVVEADPGRRMLIEDMFGEHAFRIGTTGGREIVVSDSKGLLYQEDVDRLMSLWLKPLWERMG